jgi:hypothetical protein
MTRFKQAVKQKDNRKMAGKITPVLYIFIQKIGPIV